jgi:ADP-ribose pyrophosphatase YjhB (NUDIX family)
VPEVPCAGAVVFDGGGRLLLVRRGRPPGVGLWSVPGGKCDPGEHADAACAREALEETGLIVRPVRLAGRVLRAGLGDDVFVIDDFVCELLGGTLAAGDDAAEARWCSPSELADLPLTSGLLDALRDWGLLEHDAR